VGRDPIPAVWDHLVEQEQDLRAEVVVISLSRPAPSHAYLSEAERRSSLCLAYTNHSGTTLNVIV